MSARPRGAVKKSEARLVAVWVPDLLVHALDEAVRSLDTDRSKYIRAALREKIRRESRSRSSAQHPAS